MNIGIIIHTIIFNERKEILVIKRASDRKVYPNLWDIPGGTLEVGEDPTQGAIREIKEETNLNINELSLFDYTHNIDEKKNKQFIRLLFITKYNGQDIKINVSEHNEYKWIDIKDEGIDDLVYYLPKILELLKNKTHKLLSFTQK